MSGKDQGPAQRDPETFGEMLLANFRPQPAIPALIVFVACILVSVMSRNPVAANGEGESVFLLLIPVCFVVSCGLAVAAGFCSLFPQLAWIVIATWALKFTQSGLLPAYNRIVLLAGIGVATAMFFVQVWRVRTGRFRPTIGIDSDD